MHFSTVFSLTSQCYSIHSGSWSEIKAMAANTHTLICQKPALLIAQSLPAGCSAPGRPRPPPLGTEGRP
eukprot:scaffold23344_cov19-Tisochrysis_lutea.AAC.1